MTGRIALYGHRGGAAEAPENTLAAIRHARAAGAAGVELDLRRTADDRLILCHDPDLVRLAGRPERVAELPLAELVAVELAPPGFPAARERLPALEAALAAASGLALDLELKCDPGDGARTARAFARAWADRAWPAGAAVTSFDPEAVGALARAAPALPLGLILDRPPRDEAWARHGVVSLELGLAATGLVEAARARGLAVFVWTVDDAAALATLAARGVAVAITDRPAALAAQATRSIGR